MNDQEYLAFFSEYPQEPGSLIPLLQKFQHRFGYISQEDIHQISNYLKLSENAIFGVATFYSQFRFDPPGKHSIRVCLGTACHVSGGKALAETVERTLNIKSGQTTADNHFDYQEVACLGCCAQAAVVQIDHDIYGKMTPFDLKKKLEEYE